MLKKYRSGFDVSGLIIFLIVMLPTFFWLAVPAPDDILRKESATGLIDTIASVCQIMFVASLCVLINRESNKLRVSPLVISSAVCER